LLLGKRFSDRKRLVLWAQTVIGLPKAPQIGLTVEVSQIDIGACGKEARACKTYRSFNPTFFIVMGSSP
jgi:hypothetical protein